MTASDFYEFSFKNVYFYMHIIILFLIYSCISKNNINIFTELIKKALLNINATVVSLLSLAKS